MCTIVTIKNRIELRGQVHFYKIFVISVETDGSVSVNSPFYNFVWIPGWNETPTNECSTNGNMISGGAFHVFRHMGALHRAEKWWGFLSNGKYQIAKVECDGFLGGNKEEAAFRKVFLPQEEYDRIIEAAK